MNPRDTGIPRTYESGPSDPVRLTDGPGTWVDIEIEAPTSIVWSHVIDINLPSRFSQELESAEWNESGPGLGATFTGHNRHAAIGAWTTQNFVTAYEEGRVFGWSVSDPTSPGARWRYDLLPIGLSTRLRFSMVLGPGPSGLTMAIAGMPDKEARIIHRRLAEHHANMQTTVEGIKAFAEAAA